MSQAKVSFSAHLSGDGLRIAIVQARFNEVITDALTEACHAQLLSMGVAEDDIEIVTVPGALEIGLALSALAETNEFDGLVAIGCVIRGDTYHFDIVCNEACRAVTQISLDHQLPVANAILTVETEEQAQARVFKGGEAAQVVVEMVRLLNQIADA